MVTHEHEGYLWKWTNYFGGWQQRWFVLKDGSLTYYKDANTTETGCRGSFKLEACNITVHPVDVLRFDLTTSSQRIYLKTNTKPCRQKWIIQLGTTKANISEEMPDVATVALASFNEHKSELKTVRLLLSEQIDTICNICNQDDIDGEKLKQSQAMINELCEEFLKTLDSCTSNIVGGGGGDDRDGSTLVKRSSSHSFTEGSLQSPTPVSLGSYFPPQALSQDVIETDLLILAQEPDLSSSISSGEVSTESKESRTTCNEEGYHCAGSKRASKLPCTYFSSVADRFEDLYLRGDAIPTVAFLDACVAVPKLLLTIGGKALITLSIDISNNISKIQTKQKLHPSKSDTLQALIHYEIGTQTTHAKHSATVALLWLYRELGFVKEFMLSVAEAAGVSQMTTRFTECYDTTLRPHHSMMSRSLYTVAGKAIPYREDMLRALGHDGYDNTDSAVLTDLKTYARAMNTTIKYIESFYANNKLLS